MEIADLKTNMLVKSEQGDVAVVLLGTQDGDIIASPSHWAPLSALTLEKRHVGGIVEVRQPHCNSIIGIEAWETALIVWERKGE